MSRLRKSLIAPQGITESTTYYMMGDTYIRNILVTQLPREFYLGMLSFYTRNPNIKVFVRTNHLEMDISKPLNKEMKDKEESIRKTRDEALKERYINEYHTLQNYIKEIVANNDKTLNLIIVFAIRSDSIERLNSTTKDFLSELRLQGIKTTTLQRHQLDLLKVTSPMFIGNNMSKTLNFNLGVPVTTQSFAGMWAYTFQTLKDKYGFIFASERNTAGIIQWDPLLYLNDPIEANNQSRLNGNIIVLGASGYGKSTDMNLIIRYLIRSNLTVVWLDPENKNERLVKKYGGTFIKWGNPGNQINIFDLKPISVDDDEEQIDSFNTELAIYNVIDEFKNVLRLYKPNIADDTLDVISELVIKMYKLKGIDFETDFKTLVATDYPILSDLKQVIQDELDDVASMMMNDDKKKKALEDLRMKISPMLLEHKIYFDGHTTIKVDENKRNILGFGSKVLFSKDTTLRNALNYMMFSYIKALCLNPTIMSATIFDEAHMYLSEGKAAEEMSIIWRRARKYKNVSVLGTQESGDFSSAGLEQHGKAIINNSAYKIIKYLEKDALTSLIELIDLNDNEIEAIKSFKRGDALFVSGKKHIAISVLATENELEEFEGKERVF